MTDPDPWIAATRASHNRFAALTASLAPDQVTARSYDTEWTNADVASHLGSQAEIFGPYFEAGLGRRDAPDGSSFAAIWDRWNALAPTEQVQQSIAANEAFVTAVEQMTAEERAAFSVELFGRQLDLDQALGARLSEHAVHTWDVAVSLDPSATVAADATALLIDSLKAVAERSTVTLDADPVTVRTTRPDRIFVLGFRPTISLETGEPTAAADVELPAEAFLRLVYGRLDPDHTPAETVGSPETLDLLRRAFPGF